MTSGNGKHGTGSRLAVGVGPGHDEGRGAARSEGADSDLVVLVRRQADDVGGLHVLADVLDERGRRRSARTSMRNPVSSLAVSTQDSRIEVVERRKGADVHRLARRNGGCGFDVGEEEGGSYGEQKQCAVQGNLPSRDGSLGALEGLNLTLWPWKVDAPHQLTGG